MLPLVIGDDFIWIGSVKDEDGAVYPLGGCTVWWTVTRRHGRPDGEAAAKLYWAASGGSDGITVDAPLTGEFEIRLTPEQTALFQQAAYHYDVQIDDAAGRLVTADRGVISARWSPTTRTTTP